MLPARGAQTPSLRHVLAGASASLTGGQSLLSLPPARSAAVVLVDGLGSAPLGARAGHARRMLAAVPKKGGSIHSGFPPPPRRRSRASPPACCRASTG